MEDIMYLARKVGLMPHRRQIRVPGSVDPSASSLIPFPLPGGCENYPNKDSQDGQGFRGCGVKAEAYDK